MPPKPSPTHFLCIPLSASPQLARSLAAFRADVTSPLTFALPEDAVRPLGTLHLTLGVMSLRDAPSIERAVDLLKAIKLQELLSNARKSQSIPRQEQEVEREEKQGDADPTPESDRLEITIQGLHAMQTPSRTSVLYAPPVDMDGTLRSFCLQLRQRFTDEELMMDEGRPLLLHATVINTIYVKGQRRQGQKRGERMTIDARDLLSKYDDYPWAERLPVTKVAICRMGAKKIEGTDDEAYEVEAEISF